MATQPHSRRVSQPYRLVYKGWRRNLLLIVLLAFSSFVPAAPTTVTLNYADAEEVAESLDGLVEEGGTLRVYQNMLIIDSSAVNVAELVSIIEVLDSTPRSLLVSLKSPSQAARQNDVFKVSGSPVVRSRNYQNNADGTVTETRVEVTSRSRGQQASADSTMSIRALEGQDAFVRIASVDTTQGLSGNSDGFWVNARVQGDQVSVAVRRRQDSVDENGLATSAVATQARGQLGKWFPIGSLSGSSQGSGRTYNSRAWNSRSTASVVYMKVELQ